MSAQGFTELWMLLRDGPRPPGALAEVMSARGIGTASRTLNSIAVLEEMGVVDASSDHVRARHDDWPAGTVHERLREALLAHYCRLLPEASLGPAFQHDLATGLLQADRVLLPYRELGLPYLLIDFGIMARANGRGLLVAPDAAPAFLDAIAVINSRAVRARPMTPSQLEAWLAARKAAGEVAEAFAMEFERERLRGHQLLDQVRWVAHEDVGAGHDILSFDDERSLLLDRWIEVKGFTGEPGFEWSAAEMAQARLKREKYWLYLVDRDRVREQGYQPEMLNDPFTYLVEVNPLGWLREPTSYRFTAPARVG